MKRLVSYLILLTLALSVLLSLASCTNFDRAEERLVEAGYNVMRGGKGAPEDMVGAVDEDVEANMKATAGPNGEWVTVIRFKEKDLAKEFYDLQAKAYAEKYFMSVKRDGRTVIYGWTAAVELVD